MLATEYSKNGKNKEPKCHNKDVCMGLLTKDLFGSKIA